ncbi:thiamine-phosphate kinase [Glaesserella sp.]|uniref:thiamine-phosphate kinase n=1 Tax=Glaesserella sp. TaxID=2094731 RepID=UPI00359F6AF2
MGEFDLIRQYFTRDKRSERRDILQNIGDDCAVTSIESNQQLAITTDTLVVGTHFLPTISPADLAHKAIAVNLSDLAAMGAKPSWVSLALTLQEIDHGWLSQFSQNLFEVLDRYDVALIGGDTTKGNLSLTLTAQGVLPKSRGLFRHNAKVGDRIYVSGNLGDSAAGLNILLNPTKQNRNSAQNALIERHLRPTPRVELGQILLDYSRCAIDISDGLLADLGHILNRSQCSAEIDLDKLPLSQALLSCYSVEQAQQFALSGGEDYELCFTVAEQHCAKLEQTLNKLAIPFYAIGLITDISQPLRLLKQGKTMPLPDRIGFDHFG